MRAIGSAAPAGKLSFGRVYLYSTLRPLVRSFVRSFTRKREHADTDVRVYVFVHFRFSRTFPVTALGVPPRTGMSANQSKSPNGCTMTAPELSLGLPRPPPTPALPPNPPPPTTTTTLHGSHVQRFLGICPRGRMQVKRRRGRGPSSFGLLSGPTRLRNYYAVRCIWLLSQRVKSPGLGTSAQRKRPALLDPLRFLFCRLPGLGCPRRSLAAAGA